MKITIGSAPAGFSSIGVPREIGMTVGGEERTPTLCGQGLTLGFVPDPNLGVTGYIRIRGIGGKQRTNISRRSIEVHPKMCGSARC